MSSKIYYVAVVSFVTGGQRLVPFTATMEWKAPLTEEQRGRIEDHPNLVNCERQINSIDLIRLPSPEAWTMLRLTEEGAIHGVLACN